MSKKLLTREAFLAVVVYELTHLTEGHWLWLCLTDKARQEMIHDASAKFEIWKAMELEEEQRRDAGPGEGERRGRNRQPPRDTPKGITVFIPNGVVTHEECANGRE